MKDQRFIDAYDKIQPGNDVFDRVLGNAQRRLAEERLERRRLMGKRVVLIAACTAMLIALSTIAIATYERWKLPEPARYVSPDGGNVSIHSEENYIYSEDTFPATESEGTTPQDQEVQWTDERFIREAIAILELVGLEDVETTALRVTRQKNHQYDREEAVVYFKDSSVKTSVKFNAETGTLISLSSIDQQTSSEPVCKTEAEAETLARSYYEKLPVPQDYILTGYEAYDEQYWSYSFCREVSEGLYSYYEMARIAINPVSGRLTGCNVFYLPLLDDHEPGDVPLTQQEAESIATELKSVDLSEYILESAAIDVVHPNYVFTEHSSIDLEACKVTRLGWRLVYNNPNSFFADKITILIDLYTGELLGGDMT